MLELILLALVVSNVMLWLRVRRLEAGAGGHSTGRFDHAAPADRPVVMAPPVWAPPPRPAADPGVAPPSPARTAPRGPLVRTTTIAAASDDAVEVAASEAARSPFPPAPQPPTPPPPSPSAPAPRPKRGGFEELFGSKLPIWAGGITLAVAGLFIVKYSIDTGLLSPAVRVVFALLFAAALVAAAEVSRRWRATAIDPRVAQALAGAGIAVAYAAVLLAANLYSLIGEGTAFVALATITATALGLALRFGAPCAVLGLVGGLAAPALAGGTGNAATLAIYLILAVSGLTGVARMQGWRWLSAAALVGGFGWGGAMLVEHVIDTAAALSIGGYLLVLALAVPVLAGGVAGGTMGRLTRLLPPAAAAIQLAILIELGGHRPLVWGLYALLSVGVVVLARIDRRLFALPPVALAVGAIVVALWTAPAATILLPVLLVGALLFGADAAARLWPVRRQVSDRVDALQLGGALVAAIALGMWKDPQLGDTAWGMLAALAAVVPLVLAARAWMRPETEGASRNAGHGPMPAILVAAALILLDAAAALLVASAWLPVVMAALAVASAWAARTYDDAWAAMVARVGLVAAGLAIFADAGWPREFGRAVGDAALGLSVPSALRYALVALAVAAFAALDRAARAPAQVAAALLGTLALAQVVPPAWMAFACALAALAVVEGARLRRVDVAPALAGFAVVTLGWALDPFATVALGALDTLAGQPLVSANLPPVGEALLRLAGPAALLGTALVRAPAVGPLMLRVGFIVLAIVGGAGLLVVFKQAFAGSFGSDFAAHGFAERLTLTTILYALGWAAWRETAKRKARAPWLRPFALGVTLLALARTIGFDVLIYNPLLRTQAVGALPLVNLLAVAYLLPLFWLRQAGRSDHRFAAGRVVVVQIGLVLAYAAAAVRQAFHGTLIAGLPVPQGESIAFSLVAIAVAVGFLLWGIRVRLRAWRIASLALMLGALAKVFLLDASGLEGLARIGSFVALGFSLIGIGWLYSRYLTLEVIGETPGEATG